MRMIMVLDKGKINKQIKALKRNNNFPGNLEYVDSYTDPKQVRPQVLFK